MGPHRHLVDEMFTFFRPSLSLDDSYYYPMRVFFLLFNTIIFWFVIVVYFWPFFLSRKSLNYLIEFFCWSCISWKLFRFVRKGLVTITSFFLVLRCGYFRLCLGRYHFFKKCKWWTNWRCAHIVIHRKSQHWKQFLYQTFFCSHKVAKPSHSFPLYFFFLAWPFELHKKSPSST